MRRYRVPRATAVAVAIVVPLSAGLLTLMVAVPIRLDVALLASVAMVLAVAWLGGIWAALLCTLLVALWLGGPLRAEFTLPIDGWSIFLFVAAAMMVTAGIESLHRARWRVESARDRARSARLSEHALRAELESILGAIGEGVLVVEADGAISLTNDAAVDSLGRRPDTFAELVEVFVQGPEVANPSHLLEGNGSTIELRLAEGNRRVELSAFPLEADDETGRRVVMLRDVTEARQRELLRDAFLSVLSHELRTPMTAVYGGATLLQRSGDKLDPETRNDLRADIVHEAERLSRLIDDLLVLTRVEEGVEVGHEPALLQHLVTSVVNQERLASPGRTIEIAADPGLPPVSGDETSIRQVTHNLLSNALKYSPAGSVVEVRVERADKEVMIRVLDRGRGLSEEEAARVFEPFYRADDVAGAAAGIGIGLFVSRRLVDAMNGRIWAASREGGGAEFGFALPIWFTEFDDEEVPPVAAEAKG